MTADWARLAHDLLEQISSRIVNEVSGVNCAVYDITSKPPAPLNGNRARHAYVEGQANASCERELL